MHGKGQCKICDEKIIACNFPYRPWYQLNPYQPSSFAVGETYFFTKVFSLYQSC